MGEKELENELVRKLRDGCGYEDALEEIKIVHSTSAMSSIRDLCRHIPYEVYQDTSTWNTFPDLMVDVIGGMTPDIVIRSRVSGQNRIYIEVKETSPLNYETNDSQVIRYFLHLLSTSDKQPKGYSDIDRAILLAAPSSWFCKASNGKAWNYFKEKYRDLASVFGITIGDIRLDSA
jgi:hypothetical protein